MVHMLAALQLAAPALAAAWAALTAAFWGAFWALRLGVYAVLVWTAWEHIIEERGASHAHKVWQCSGLALIRECGPCMQLDSCCSSHSVAAPLPLTAAQGQGQAQRQRQPEAERRNLEGT